VALVESLTSSAPTVLLKVCSALLNKLESFPNKEVNSVSAAEEYCSISYLLSACLESSCSCSFKL
jgi:hypothetical protein